MGYYFALPSRYGIIPEVLSRSTKHHTFKLENYKAYRHLVGLSAPKDSDSDTWYNLDSGFMQLFLFIGRESDDLSIWTDISALSNYEKWQLYDKCINIWIGHEEHYLSELKKLKDPKDYSIVKTYSDITVETEWFKR